MPLNHALTHARASCGRRNAQICALSHRNLRLAPELPAPGPNTPEPR